MEDDRNYDPWFTTVHRLMIYVRFTSQGSNPVSQTIHTHSAWYWHTDFTFSCCTLLLLLTVTPYTIKDWHPKITLRPKSLRVFASAMPSAKLKGEETQKAAQMRQRSGSLLHDSSLETWWNTLDVKWCKMMYAFFWVKFPEVWHCGSHRRRTELNEHGTFQVTTP